MLGQVAGLSAPRDTHGQPATRRLCGSQVQHSVSAWGVVFCWQLPAAESTALELWGNWGPSGLGFFWQAMREPWSIQVGLQLVGHGCNQNFAMSWPSLVGGQGPRSALSDILKPLVRGRSISHVSLVCGIKSNERTLLIYHKRWGQAFLNNCLCAVAASLGDQQHRLGIHEGVARCPRPKSQRCRFPATQPAQGQNVPQASLLPLPGGRGTREVLLVS